MEVFMLAVIIGCIPGAIAQKKGHDFVTWWIFGAALFIVALPMSLMLKPKPHQLEEPAEPSEPQGFRMGPSRQWYHANKGLDVPGVFDQERDR
jgi:uncharacterized membrane protein YfcA